MQPSMRMRSAAAQKAFRLVALAGIAKVTPRCQKYPSAEGKKLHFPPIPFERVDGVALFLK